MHVVTGAEGVEAKSAAGAPTKKNAKAKVNIIATEIDYTNPDVLAAAGVRICAWAAAEAAKSAKGV